ncbi:MAG: cyclic nucleotide-binding domain-containing protein [Bdellovibrionota bacterium]
MWHFTQSLAQKIDGCIEEILLQTPNERFMEELDQKHEVSNLRKLTDQEINAFSLLFEPIYLERQDKVYSAHDDRIYFYILVDGRIECTHPNRHPITIQRGEYFGEMVFCGPGYQHLYDAHVISDEATLLQISHKQLSGLSQFKEQDQKFLADMLVRILSNKNKELRELLYQARYLKNKG